LKFKHISQAEYNKGTNRTDKLNLLDSINSIVNEIKNKFN
jgi:hypothetical protein